MTMTMTMTLSTPTPTPELRRSPSPRAFSKNLSSGDRGPETGFSLVEMMVAITVTLIIMGSVYGLMAQGQNAFGREPLVSDRQQQLRLALDRIQKDVVGAGLGTGPYAQTFAPGLNGLGPIGVSVAAVDPLRPSLGGGMTDILEIRSMSVDCPLLRTVPGAAGPPAAGTALVGSALQTVDPFPPAPANCFQTPGWVFLLYPNGWSKFGWLSNLVNNQSTFAAPQPDGSQIDTAAVPAHVLCSIWFGNQNNSASPNDPNNPSPNCTTLPPVPPSPPSPPAPAPTPDPQSVGGCPSCDPYAIAQADFIRYQIGNDADGVIGLFRSSSGGVQLNGGAPSIPATAPPGPAWQLVARGIEDFQVEYRSLNSTAVPAPNDWLSSPALITNGALTGPGDVVVEVRVTLWSRVVGATPQVAGNPGDRLTGESRAPGNQVMAVRGSFVSRIAPRAAQEALAYTGQWR